jgi:hypothetical protein
MMISDDAIYLRGVSPALLWISEFTVLPTVAGHVVIGQCSLASLSLATVGRRLGGQRVSHSSLHWRWLGRHSLLLRLPDVFQNPELNRARHFVGAKHTNCPASRIPVGRGATRPVYRETSLTVHLRAQ